jgi:hypothetical protein
VAHPSGNIASAPYSVDIPGSYSVIRNYKIAIQKIVNPVLLALVKGLRGNACQWVWAFDGDALDVLSYVIEIEIP